MSKVSAGWAKELITEEKRQTVRKIKCFMEIIFSLERISIGAPTEGLQFKLTDTSVRRETLKVLVFVQDNRDQ